MPIDSPRELISPFDLSDDDGYEWLKGNLHSHSTNSDGNPSPQERLDGYVNNGYGFLCISDHYKITRIDSVNPPDDFVLVQGAELHPQNPFGGTTHHFVCLNIHEDMDSQKMPPQHVIDAVNEQGGLVWLAHPYWSSVNYIRDVKPLHGFAGVEVFNTTCRVHGRGESGVHWNDWMEQENRLYPMLANDDAHASESENKDTYQSWTMARVKERSPQAVLDALASGTTYGSTGPEIRDIKLRRVDDAGEDQAVVEATISSSEAVRIFAVCNLIGAEYYEGGRTFESATFKIRRGSQWVRFEVVAPDGTKAWSNPYDLTDLERE
jgi:hypothetical protein